ncbi:hypothetical protein MKW98_013932 [Papaver atlanticum]|uniref:Wax synthase domain-containing protein n=1 Tax=Papaver atlanticum TaxID=357466 RepID=A0AAD4X5T6_9MAGN|nr:hypothetical protein MKW98_013932 [Papaver atlanticum]
MNEFAGDGGEFGRFIKVWCTVFSSLTYCYYIARNIPKGFPRLLSVLPIVYIFSLLPLNLTSIHFTIGVGFFISWLANFKLLLFCYDSGPLSSNPLPVLPSSTSSMTLLRFLAIACLPIMIKQSNPSSSFSSSSASLFLVIYAALARLIFNLEVEPPFGNMLVISSSFHEFWGRRWNKVVSSLLRSLIYEPVRRITKQSWGIYVAILATFSVSGLMHELIIFYIGRKIPQGNLFVFFILHGIGMSVEIYLKRSSNGKCQLHRLGSQLILSGMLVLSCYYLINPSLERNRVDLMVNKEIAGLIKIIKSSSRHRTF